MSYPQSNMHFSQFIETFGQPWRRGEASKNHLAVMAIHHKDFIQDVQNGIGMQQLVMQMHDFFIEHPHYKMTDYEPISNGLRAYYEIIQ